MREYIVRFSGIQTFLGKIHMPVPKGDEDVVVIGIPLDSGTSYMPGARFGPSAIRRASMIYKFNEDEGLLDIQEGRTLLKGIKIVDLGDIDVPFGDQKKAMDVIYSKVLSLLPKNKKFFGVFLGGDHSITFPLVRAMRTMYEDLGLIHIDAHLDTRNLHAGSAYTHATSIMRCIDEAKVNPTKIFQIGMRGFLTPEEAYMNAKNVGTNIFTIKDFRRIGAKSLVNEITTKVKDAPMYLTFDIDAMDASIAPGTGIPEPGGFTYDEALELVDHIFSNLNVVAMDIVEVSPLLDVNDITSRLAVSIILKALGTKFSAKVGGGI